MGISGFVTVTQKFMIFLKNLDDYHFCISKNGLINMNFCTYFFNTLCNKGVWVVPICNGVLHIGVWGLKMVILGVT